MLARVVWMCTAAGLMACGGDFDGKSGLGSNDTGSIVVTPTDTGDEPPITTLLTAGGAQTCLWVQGGNDRVRSTLGGMPVGDEDRTVDAWVRTKATDAQVAVSIGLASPGKAFYLGTDDGYLMVSNGGLLHADANAFVADGEWHHIAATFSRDSATLLLDGVEGASVVLDDTNTSDGEIVAGGAPTTGGLPWVGWLDDVRSYSRVLSAAELTSASPDDRALSLWWDFEIDGEGAGLTVPDLSLTGADGITGGSDDSPSFLACR